MYTECYWSARQLWRQPPDDPNNFAPPPPLRYAIEVPAVERTPSWGKALPAFRAEEAAHAAQVGLRLLSDLKPLYDRLPPEARSGLGLARCLGVDRGTATRFAGICSKPMDGLEVLCAAPGVRGLRQILAAMARHGLPKAALTAAASGVDRFERLIRESGGSQTKLAWRVDATRARGQVNDPEAQERSHLARRKRLFESAAGVLGQRMDLWLVAHVFRPSPKNPERMDQAMLRATFGYRARRDSPTYAIRSFGRNDGAAPELRPGEEAYHSLERPSAPGVPEETVFREFSTDPLPLVTTRGVGKESLVVVDAERSSEEQGLDVVLGHALLDNWRMPTLDTPPTHDVSSHIAVPSERLVFDVYLHRSMARMCLPSMRVYRTTPGLFYDIPGHWPDILPYGPSLQIVATEPRVAGSRLYHRHAELLDAFFGRLRWPVTEFVGYRIEVEYPIWGGFYCLTFDYSSPAPGA